MPTDSINTSAVRPVFASPLRGGTMSRSSAAASSALHRDGPSARQSKSLSDRPRSREHAGRPPDRPQQRRHSLRPLLQARLAQGPACARAGGRCTNSARSTRSLTIAAGKSSSPRGPKSCRALEELERRGAANGLEGVKRLNADEIRRATSRTSPASPACTSPRRASSTTARSRTPTPTWSASAAEMSAPTRGSTAVDVRPDRDHASDDGGRVTAAARELRRAAIRPRRADVRRRAGGPDRPVPRRVLPARRGRTDLVRNLVYPVPDPRFPFLGVHFTRMIGGGVEAGPNAVLALARHGYTRTSFNARDAVGVARLQGLLADGEASTGGPAAGVPPVDQQAGVPARAAPAGPRAATLAISSPAAPASRQAVDPPARSSTTSASCTPRGWCTCSTPRRPLRLRRSQ